MHIEKNNFPLISIVTPCYNSSRFIHRLHESLRQQDFRNFEWILVDDLSIDDTVKVILDMPSPGEGGISIYRLPQNSGGGVALGFGVEKCRGEIVILVDHDDELVASAFSTIVNEWWRVKDRPEMAGFFYRRLNPALGKTIGGDLEPGTEFSMSWLANMKPSITDGFIVFKASVVKSYFNPGALESICLSGVALNFMTKKYKLLAGSLTPLLIYHRDNPESQTNFVRISRKTVYTYAKYIDGYDFYYLRRPLHWMRHVVALIKFSFLAHGNPIYHHRFIDSKLIRCLSVVLIPFGYVSYLYSRRTTTVVDLPVFQLDQLSAISEMHS